MSRPAIEMSYPLAWPPLRPRTPACERKPALWRNEGRRLTLDVARTRLRDQCEKVSHLSPVWRVDRMTLSTQIRFTPSGARDRNVSRHEPADPGVVFAFRLDRIPHVLACDRWDTVADNIAAIAAHIEALRGQERWGVATLAEAFAGHAMLPPPGAAGAVIAGECWWTVLGLGPGASLAEIDAAWREGMRTAHPDAGGSAEAAARLNAARAAGRLARG